MSDTKLRGPDTFTKQYLSRQRLLVVAPHADDETAGAGGLMARVKDAGGKVYVMVMSTGDLLHFDATGKKTKKKTRREELAAAMKTLDVDAWEIVYEDTRLHLRLETLPRRDLADRIERSALLATEKTKPTMIVLPAPSYNQDHEAVYKAGLAACRPGRVVLGPDSGGGYYLIAATCVPPVFEGIEWGCQQVLEQTRAAAAHAGMSVHLVDTMADVDTVDDLQRVAASSRTAAWLRKTRG